jgi:hypothetical protein
MQKKLKTRSILMLASFFALLGVIFSPVFPGNINGLDFMDNLFNKISKGSVYFIPSALESSEQYMGQVIDVTFAMDNEQQATDTAQLFRASGAEISVSGTELSVKGDMGQILKSSLNDANLMFQNEGAPLKEAYGLGEKQVLFNWWKAFGGIIKDLNKQKSFKEAKIFDTVQKKALEPAYNYYGVESGNYKDYFFLIVAALAFYVIYTLWYGFGIMFLFEGLGLQIGH